MSQVISNISQSCSFSCRLFCTVAAVFPNSSLKKARFLDIIVLFFIVLYCEQCKVTSKPDPGSISKAMNVRCSVCIIEKKKENLSQTCSVSFCVNNDFKIYIYLYIYISHGCVYMLNALYNLRFVLFFFEKTIFLWITAKFTKVDP